MIDRFAPLFSGLYRAGIGSGSALVGGAAHRWAGSLPALIGSALLSLRLDGHDWR